MLERIRQLCLMDDEFMTKVFEDDPVCTEIMLRIILERDDIEVLSVETQKTINSLEGHSVRLDIVAKDASGKIFNVEVQRKDSGNERRRARYYCSVLDCVSLGKGQDYSELPDVYVIFIMEKDIFGDGEPVYRVGQTLNGRSAYEDGRHIVFVNGAAQTDTAIGMLMHDFRCRNADEMKIPQLRARVKHFKDSEEGAFVMSGILDEMREEVARETEAKTRLADWINAAKSIIENFHFTKETAVRGLNIPLEYRDTVLAAL